MSSLSLLETLHDNLSTLDQVKSAFGDPVVPAKKTVMAVAKICYGFGAGAGTGGVGERSAKGEGGGGGGGVRATPVGVFEVSANQTRFVPVRDRKQQAAFVLAGAALGMLLLRRR